MELMKRMLICGAVAASVVALPVAAVADGEVALHNTLSQQIFVTINDQTYAGKNIPGNGELDLSYAEIAGFCLLTGNVNTCKMTYSLGEKLPGCDTGSNKNCLADITFDANTKASDQNHDSVLDKSIQTGYTVTGVNDKPVTNISIGKAS